MEAERFPTPKYFKHTQEKNHVLKVFGFDPWKRHISSHLFELLNLGLFKHAEHIGAALHRLLLHLLWWLMTDIEQ